MPQESLDQAIRSLDPSPWVVSLTKADRAVYARMVEAEHAYVKKFARAKCLIARPESDTDRVVRRTLIVVLPDVRMPDPSEMMAAVAAWREVVETAAAEQGKESTVGIRGATLPVWIGEQGIDHLFSEPRPDYVAQRVTHHQQPAYRGAALTPAAALKVLTDKKLRTENALAHSRRKSKKDRIPAQENRIEQLDAAMAQLMAFMRDGRAVSVRMHSGLSWRINVRTTDKRSIASSVATIALVPGTRETRIGPAPRRIHAEDESIEAILLPGGLELRIKRV